MSRWNASRWRRAVGRESKENIKHEVRVRIEVDGKSLKAEEVRVYDRIEYHVAYHERNNDGDFINDIYRVYHNKEDANAMFVYLKRKYF